jgi:hypothetical protein
MGSSGSSDPRFLSQGGVPIPNLPIAGQGAPNDNPRNFGAFQEFLPEISPQGRSGYQILPAGQGPAPSARGLTAEMFQYRSPQGVVAPSGGGAAAAAAGGGAGGGGDTDSLRQQLAALQSQVNQFGAAQEQPGFGQYGQQSAIGFPQNWTNSNVPFATS